MGCGCGVIGIAVAKFRPMLKVTLVDVNPLAIMLSKENAEINGISNSIVMQSDLYSNLEGKQFDLIISNPPLAAGYKVIFPLIEGAKSHLKEGCSLQIVLRKGVNAIPKKMAEIFGNVDLISKKSGYRVFRSIKET
jgi:16S rRNA (guanine1207-N2)-methyltransferase